MRVQRRGGRRERGRRYGRLVRRAGAPFFRVESHGFLAPKAVDGVDGGGGGVAVARGDQLQGAAEGERSAAGAAGAVDAAGSCGTCTAAAAEGIGGATASVVEQIGAVQSLVLVQVGGGRLRRDPGGIERRRRSRVVAVGDGGAEWELTRDGELPTQQPLGAPVKVGCGVPGRRAGGRQR